MSASLGFAVAVLFDDAERLPNRMLRDLVFNESLRLEHVCSYLAWRGRDEAFSTEHHWVSLQQLTEMGRQSPWAKLWLLTTACRLPSSGGNAFQNVLRWVRSQLEDRHELVRAEASWTLAQMGELDGRMIGMLYARASRLTFPALAAAAGKQGNVQASVANAIRDDSPLNRRAFEWAQ
jgi:hypothetical protein